MSENKKFSAIDVNFQDLDDCLKCLDELQKKLDSQPTFSNNQNKVKSKTLPNKSTSQKAVKKVEFSDYHKEEVIQVTDLDELLDNLKLTTIINMPSIKPALKTDPITIKRGQSCLTTKSTYNGNNLCVKTLKADENQNGRYLDHQMSSSNHGSSCSLNLSNSLFNKNKYSEQYSSLPRIIMDCHNQSLSVLYKSSSQTNLAHEDAEYKLALTVYQPNKTVRTIMIDETTTSGEICQLLTARNYLMPNIRFALVEKLPHLKIERCFEDDECPVACLLSYKNDAQTSLIFFEDREDKYGLFTDPKKWLGSSFEDRTNSKVITEIFNGIVPQLPTFRSHLFYRKLHKRNWHRRLCVLRNSGLYAYNKNKDPVDSTDLELIASIHPSLHLYTTSGGWSSIKTPTPFGFCLKTYGERNPKYISYFCALSESSLRYWSSLFRIVLKGKQLLKNYQNQLEFVYDTLECFQEQNREYLNPELSKSLGCVTGRLDLQTDL